MTRLLTSAFVLLTGLLSFAVQAAPSSRNVNVVQYSSPASIVVGAEYGFPNYNNTCWTGPYSDINGVIVIFEEYGDHPYTSTTFYPTLSPIGDGTYCSTGELDYVLQYSQGVLQVTMLWSEDFNNPGYFNSVSDSFTIQ